MKVSNRIVAILLALSFSTASAYAVTPAEIQQCHADADVLQATTDRYQSELDALEVSYDTESANWDATCSNLQVSGASSAELKKCRADRKAALARIRSQITAKKKQISAAKRQVTSKNTACRKLESAYATMCRKDNTALRVARNDLDRNTRQMDTLEDQILRAQQTVDRVADTYQAQMDNLKAKQDSLLILKGTMCIIDLLTGGNSQCDNIIEQIAAIQTQMGRVDRARSLAIANAQRRKDQLVTKVAPLQSKISAAQSKYDAALSKLNLDQCQIS